MAARRAGPYWARKWSVKIGVGGRSEAPTARAVGAARAKGSRAARAKRSSSRVRKKATWLAGDGNLGEMTSTRRGGPTGCDPETGWMVVSPSRFSNRSRNNPSVTGSSEVEPMRRWSAPEHWYQ